MTGPKNLCPTSALEDILGLTLLSTHKREVAEKSALRILKKTGFKPEDLNEHIRILEDRLFISILVCKNSTISTFRNSPKVIGLPLYGLQGTLVSPETKRLTS